MKMRLSLFLLRYSFFQVLKPLEKKFSSNRISINPSIPDPFASTTNRDLNVQKSAASKKEKDIISTEFDVGQRIIFVSNESHNEKFIPIKKSSNQNKEIHENVNEEFIEQDFINKDNSEHINEVTEVLENETTTEIILEDNYEIEYSEKTTKEENKAYESNSETTEKYFSGNQQF